MDFDDLLLEAVRLLKVSGEVRERYQRRYRYLLVDEYQDTNRPQYELMKLLAGEAQERLRRGRRGPEHLLLARRRHSQHSRVREGLSQRQHRSPGAELPLHADHSRSRRRRGRQQPPPQGQEALDRPPGRLR